MAVELSSVVKPDGVRIEAGRAREAKSLGAAAASSAALAMEGGGVGTDGALEDVVASTSGAGDHN